MTGRVVAMVSTAPIESSRLALTPLDPSAAVDMVSVLADPALYSFTGGAPPTLEQLTDRYAFQASGAPRPDEVWHNWIIRLGGGAIGQVQATVTDEAADVAWLVGVPWQRNGYAPEAALAMCAWLSGQGVRRFTAHIHPSHAVSAKVATALGLVPTGTLDPDGEMVWA